MARVNGNIVHHSILIRSRDDQNIFLDGTCSRVDIDSLNDKSRSLNEQLLT